MHDLFNLLALDGPFRQNPGQTSIWYLCEFSVYLISKKYFYGMGHGFCFTIFILALFFLKILALSQRIFLSFFLQIHLQYIQESQ